MRTFAALLALAFSLAGCGAVDGAPVRPAPGSAGRGSSTAASGADSAEPEQLAAMRQLAGENGDLAGVLYLGSVPERTTDVHAVLDSLPEQPWQFVADIPADRWVAAPGGGRELYCIFAVRREDTLFVYGFILDGHTRYRILRKHPLIAYQIQEIELDNRYAALSWICQNQLGRRNLDPERKKFLMGKLYESEKLARGGSKERAHDENGRFTSMVQNDPLRAKQLSTCERIAAQNGVGAATVKRAEKYAKGVDAAEDAVPGAREEILTGRIKATDAEITALAKTPKAEIPAALAELRKPKQERQPRKAETSSSKQTLSEISKSIQGHQRQLTTEERTFLKASIDNRYQERAVANGSLMMCEVQGAKEDFIRRWNSIFKEYPDVFEDSDCRKIIYDLTEDAVQYLLKIKEKTL